MHPLPLYPLHAEAESLLRYAKLSLHIGRATIGSRSGGDPEHPLIKLYKYANTSAPELSDITFDTAVLMPSAGKCLVFLQCRSDFRLQRDFYSDLTVTGGSADGPFRFHTSEIYVDAEGEGPDGQRWAIASPVNSPAELSYGEPRPIARVRAFINNFDFEGGNEPRGSGKRDILRVVAAGQIVDFLKRDGYEVIKTALKIGTSAPAPLVTFTFDSWGEASEAELVDFAFQVAGLCGLVARQHTGIPLLSLLDLGGRPIKHVLGNPLESRFRKGYVLPHLQLNCGLPQLFAQCFDNYRQMDASDLWSTIPGYCKTIEDPTYLEQKCSMLMAGLERLMRNALVEANVLSSKKAENRLLNDLIGAVKKDLGWVIPKHYTANDRIRLLRNAVAHGGPLPQQPVQVRHDLDKLSLFLMRRVLIRLGFDGPVSCPNLKAGQWDQSSVDDFSEDHNSFGT